MSEQSPIIFNEDEQIKLVELEKQCQEFANWRNATARSLHSGQDAALVGRLLQFLQHMTAQTAKQIEDIRLGAEKRSKSVVSISKEN